MLLRRGAPLRVLRVVDRQVGKAVQVGLDRRERPDPPVLQCLACAGPSTTSWLADAAMARRTGGHPVAGVLLAGPGDKVDAVGRQVRPVAQQAVNVDLAGLAHDANVGAVAVERRRVGQGGEADDGQGEDVARDRVRSLLVLEPADDYLWSQVRRRPALGRESVLSRTESSARPSSQPEPAHFGVDQHLGQPKVDNLRDAAAGRQHGDDATSTGRTDGFAPDVTMMFSGLRSRWAVCMVSRYARACMRPAMMIRVACSDRPPFEMMYSCAKASVCRPRGQTRGAHQKVAAVEELHDDEDEPVCL